jgi:hypothetical protein
VECLWNLWGKFWRKIRIAKLFAVYDFLFASIRARFVSAGLWMIASNPVQAMIAAMLMQNKFGQCPHEQH